jgi:hypothetical protein
MPVQHNSIIQVLTALPAMISMRHSRDSWRHLLLPAMALVNPVNPPRLGNGPTGEEFKVVMLGGERCSALHASYIHDVELTNT